MKTRQQGRAPGGFRRPLLRTLAPLLAIHAASCVVGGSSATDDSPEPAHSVAKLVGATVSGTRYPQVVAIEVTSASGCKSRFSGVVVGRNAILTAAHCTCGLLREGPVAYTVYAGPQKSQTSKPLMHEGRPIGVREIVLGDEDYPDLPPQEPYDDVALLFTEHPVDEALGLRFALGETAELGSESFTTGDTATFVGYSPVSRGSELVLKQHVSGYVLSYHEAEPWGAYAQFAKPSGAPDDVMMPGDAGGAIFHGDTLVGVLGLSTNDWLYGGRLPVAFVFGSDPASNRIRQALRDEAETQCGTLDEL